MCEICKNHYACTSASANWLSFNCFLSFSTHVSYSLSGDRELAPKCHRSFSFRINLLLFCLLWEVFHSGPAFSHHLIPLWLFTSAYLTSLLISVHGDIQSLPRHTSPPPPTLLLELRHEADATHHRPLDLYGPLFSPCTVKGCERGPTCCRVWSAFKGLVRSNKNKQKSCLPQLLSAPSDSFGIISPVL